jgi:hypothetical protein
VLVERHNSSIGNSKGPPQVNAGAAKGLPRDTCQTPFSAVLVNPSLHAKLFTKHAADIVVQMRR